MQKSMTVIYKMTEDDRIREAARMREKRLHDEASALFNARKEGVAEGIAKGRTKGKEEKEAEMIKGMRLAGFSDEQINNVLKFSKQENS